MHLHGLTLKAAHSSKINCSNVMALQEVNDSSIKNISDTRILNILHGSLLID